MSEGQEGGDLVCNRAALGRLMPLFVRLDREGVVVDAGPTLRKLAGPAALGRRLSEVFVLIHPRSFARARDLIQPAPLRLTLRGPAPTGFKGTAVPLEGGGGVLLNLSFSYGLREAVREHALSDTDFAATDLAFELLFLAEANAAVMAEARKFAERLRGARAQALEQALTDPLTGLRNRRGLDRAMARLRSSGTGFGLIHVDLDHFKRINDSLGHAEGDRVLVSVAVRLRAAVRDDDGVARIGGDEFVVLLPGVRDPARAAAVAERILVSLAGSTAAEEGADPGPRISASFGIVIWDGEPGVTADQILLAADQALYRSKDAGRGQISFVAGQAAEGQEAS